jgi:hypothetical protein
MDLIHTTFKSARSQKDVRIWLESKPLGYLITGLLTDVGRDERVNCRSRDFKGYRRTTKMLELAQLQDHINLIRSEGFDPNAYRERGYMLRSGIKTDGFRLKLTAFKLKESIESNTDVFTRRDYQKGSRAPLVVRITTFWKYTMLSKAKMTSKDSGIARQRTSKYWDLIWARNALSERMHTSQRILSSTTWWLLKSMYQPHFKYRRWEAQSKEVAPEGSTLTIKEMESSLPALRGPTASLSQYVLAELTHEEALAQNYDNDSNTFKRNNCDAQKAKNKEYNVLCDQLLGVVGGSVGQQRRADDNVIIRIGTGKFSTSNRLPSLRTRFESHFVRKVSFLKEQEQEK